MRLREQTKTDLVDLIANYRKRLDKNNSNSFFLAKPASYSVVNRKMKRIFKNKIIDNYIRFNRGLNKKEIEYLLFLGLDIHNRVYQYLIDPTYYYYNYFADKMGFRYKREDKDKKSSTIDYFKQYFGILDKNGIDKRSKDNKSGSRFNKDSYGVSGIKRFVDSYLKLIDDIVNFKPGYQNSSNNNLGGVKYGNS